MCGIFAYLNYLTPKDRSEILKILLDGLRRLEYRGYDSAGIGIDGVDPSKTLLVKEVGKVQKLEDKIEAMKAEMGLDMTQDTHLGIAHTRWATHGVPSELNCHPHRSCDDNDFTVVHNGIITNYKDIKNLLQTKGVKFESDTDTEVIAKLLTHLREANPNDEFRTLVQKAIGELDGAFALCFKSRLFPGECVVTRKGSPLLIGIKATNEISIPESVPVSIRDPKHYDPKQKTTIFRKDSSNPEGDEIEEIKAANPDDPIEYFFASDASAIIEHTKRVIYLEDDDVAAIKNGVLTILREKAHPQASRDIATLHMELQEIMKGSFDTFMQKEIYEQPDSLTNTMAGRINLETMDVKLGGIESHLPEIKRCRRLLLIACGTSYHSAIATRQVLEEHTLLPVMIDLASDFCDRRTPIFRDDVCFFISQSGETADTLEALRYCKSQGALIVGITNTVGSTISRESHCGVHINAGPEIGVASTKAYTSQCVSLVMFALCMSADRKSFIEKRLDIIKGLIELPNQVKEVLKIDKQVRKVAEVLYEERSLLILGRGHNYATALEAALKVKELTYMHSEGIQSGELKHGPLALVDKDTPMILFLNRNHTFESAKMAANQIISRGGRPIIVCDQGDEEAKSFAFNPDMCMEVPKTVASLQGILSVIPMQLLSYHIAQLRNCNVDCPRNLAKSVTVK